MFPSWPESLSGGGRRNRAVMEELVRGRNFTNRLHHLLGMPLPPAAAAGDSPEELVLKILRSFTEALGILKSAGAGESEEAASQATKGRNSTPSSADGSRKSEDSGESCKSSVLKDRRGCYKRRKTTHTWTKTTSTLVDDGHAWRKYGQKTILNAKYPRNYYRCTHKFDQGCQATKQVQRMEDEAAASAVVYQITYNGHHSCRKAPLPHLILREVDQAASFTGGDGGDSSSNSILLSFESNPPKNEQQNLPPFFFSSFSPPQVKQEECYEDANNQSPPSDHHPFLLSSDLTAFDSSGGGGGGHLTTVLSSSDQADSGTHSLDMDVMVGSVDFSDDVLQFDF